MNILKIILAILGLILAGWLLFAVIGFLYSALFYIVVLGAIGVVGYVGYKLIAKDRALELEERKSVSTSELENAKAVKKLEEFTRKYSK